MSGCLSCPEWYDEDGEESHHWCKLEKDHELPHRCGGFACNAAWDDNFAEVDA